jgi:hypothetical protein
VLAFPDVLSVCDDNGRPLKKMFEGATVREPMLRVEDLTVSTIVLFSGTGNRTEICASGMPPPVPVLICAVINDGIQESESKLHYCHVSVSW